MKEFHLQIATPDGIEFDGMATSLLVRCESGDIEILCGHADYFGSVGIGKARIKTNDGVRIASCAGGFLSVDKNGARLVTTTFEYAEEINVERAKAAKKAAEEILAKEKDEKAILRAEAKLARSLNRIKVAELI